MSPIDDTLEERDYPEIMGLLLSRGLLPLQENEFCQYTMDELTAMIEDVRSELREEEITFPDVCISCELGIKNPTDFYIRVGDDKAYHFQAGEDTNKQLDAMKEALIRTTKMHSHYIYNLITESRR